MSTPVLYTLISVVAVGFIALVGIFVVAFSEKKIRSFISVFIALAAGALFGDAFLHIIPESLEAGGEVAALLVIAGIVIFFITEKALHGHHGHGAHHEFAVMGVPTPELTADKLALGDIKPIGRLILISDGLHNFIDGLIIGASYLVSIEIGIATTLAVIFHEIPQEIGDFGILLYAGYTRMRALFYNFLSALTAVFGAVVALAIGAAAHSIIAIVLPLAAGAFIYIASSDLIPELQKQKSTKKFIADIFVLLIGVALMYLLLFFE